MTREERKDAIDIIQSILNKYEEDECLVTEITIGDEDIKAFKMAIKALEQEPVIDKIRAEITDCLKALDGIEKSGLNIYLPNEISGRRLTYQQCLKFIDKYKAESEVKDGNNNH